jgi:hypothetical protein
MAALTWRNVDAPDLSSSMQGFEKFSQMLNGAIGTAKAGVNDFDNITTDNVNKALAMRLASEQGSSADFKAGLPDLLQEFSQYGPQRLSYENLSAANAKVGQLAQSELTALNIEDTKGDMADELRSRTRRYEKDANTDAADPLISEYFSMAKTLPEGAEKTAAMSAFAKSPEFMDALKKIGPDALRAAFTGANEIRTGDLGVDEAFKAADRGDTRFANEQLLFGQTQSDRAEGRQALEVALDAATGAYDIQSYNQAIMGSGMSKQVQAQAISMGPERFASILAGSPDGSEEDAASSSTGDPSRIMNYEARAVGFNTMPAGVRTIGDASEFAKRVNAAGADSSAMGLYQIVGQTMRGKGGKNGVAERVFGKDWRKVEWNVANQDKMAEYIFKNNIGSASALKKQWVSLSLSEAERVRKMPWKEARQIIARKESGGNPAALERASANLRGQVDVNLGSSETARIVDRGNKVEWNDANTPTDVAAVLTGKGGSLAGEDTAKVANEVKIFAKKYGMPVKTAGLIFAEHSSGRISGWQGPVELAEVMQGMKVRRDYSTMNRLGNLWKKDNGATFLADTQAIGDIQSAKASATATEAKYRADQTLYQKLLYDKNNGKPNLDLSSALAKMNKSRTEWERAVRVLGNQAEQSKGLTTPEEPGMLDVIKGWFGN